MISPELRITADNSSTLYVPELDETYHSVNGAIQESNHIFINLGLRPCLEIKEECTVFEMGFGTGLNALLTLIETEKYAKHVEYISIEKFPLEQDVVTSLNYARLLNVSEDMFLQLHECPWGEHIRISDYFTLSKIYGDLTSLSNQNVLFPNENSVDTVYFDAFSPSRQPELWSENVLQLMYNILKPEGTLVTYCAKNSFKKELKQLNFIVETLPGPPGKREITRAHKNG
ncbi:MAG: tRNA (5-methylaminomethyl-2-thiouridine)(34)-methyltransferase MnmD [Bacteroidales bacterium]|nr:tRNA (5-methylaminomethyl-2-thiouridine)(34)-methyltransferase MnmD [Bacteroidales bacterium]